MRRTLYEDPIPGTFALTRLPAPYVEREKVPIR